jgi:hypothetical protein
MHMNGELLKNLNAEEGGGKMGRDEMKEKVIELLSQVWRKINPFCPLPSFTFPSSSPAQLFSPSSLLSEGS